MQKYRQDKFYKQFTGYHKIKKMKKVFMFLAVSFLATTVMSQFVSVKDTGTKTATFTGIVQVNNNAVGVTATIITGTVSGTLPKLTAQLQYCADEDSTWFTMGAATDTIYSTGHSIVLQIYPTNYSTAGASPGALAIGSTVYKQMNGILPRVWRIKYTISGTNPSFFIKGVYVDYK